MRTRFQGIPLEISAVPGDQVPRPVDPLPADIDPGIARGDPSEPGVHTVRIKHPSFVRSDQGTCGLPLAKPQPGSGCAGRLETQRRNPTTIHHDDWAAGKPVAIVDDDVRIALTLDENEMGTDHGALSLRACSDSQCPGNLAAQGGAPKPKLVDRARQRQGLETGHGKVFNKAK